MPVCYQLTLFLHYNHKRTLYFDTFKDAVEAARLVTPPNSDMVLDAGGCGPVDPDIIPIRFTKGDACFARIDPSDVTPSEPYNIGSLKKWLARQEAKPAPPPAPSSTVVVGNKAERILNAWAKAVLPQPTTAPPTPFDRIMDDAAASFPEVEQDTTSGQGAGLVLDWARKVAWLREVATHRLWPGHEVSDRIAWRSLADSTRWLTITPKHGGIPGGNRRDHAYHLRLEWCLGNAHNTGDLINAAFDIIQPLG